MIKLLVIKRVEAVGYAPGDDTLNIDGMLEYQVECIGSDNVTFTDLMTTILQQEASQTPVDDSTVTENLEWPAESLTLAETVTATAPARNPITTARLLHKPAMASRPIRSYD